ncbi:HEAT repeat domain-containing protein [Cytobacillus suaedae]|nr:HEAT repeat domain-containing protein [Cytobacillus suaedae]
MLRNEIIYFFLCLSILIILLSLLLVYLMIRKARENKRKAKIEDYKEKHREQMFAYIYKNQTTRMLVPDNELKLQAIEELLGDFANVLSGEQAERNITGFATDHFVDYYRENLSSRRWSQRMNTLYMIEDFNLSLLMPEVLQLYQSKKVTKSEESQILQLMSKFDYPDILDKIQSSKFNLSEFTYRSIFNKMTPSTLEYTIAKYHQLPYDLQLPLIDIIGVKNLIHKGPFLEKLLRESSGKEETKIRILKVISEIGYPLPNELVEKFLQSSNWAIRMMAAKVCGTLREDVLLPYLKPLLIDEHFSVRTQAARSLLLYPNGKELLEEIIKTTDDMYARDMAIDWLERGTNYELR